MFRLLFLSILIFLLSSCAGAPIPISKKTKVFEEKDLIISESVTLDFCTSSAVLTGISLYRFNPENILIKVYEGYDYFFPNFTRKGRHIHEYYVVVESCKFLVRAGIYEISYVAIPKEIQRISYDPKRSTVPLISSCYHSEVSGLINLQAGHTYTMQMKSCTGSACPENCRDSGATTTWLVDDRNGNRVLGSTDFYKLSTE